MNAFNRAFMALLALGWVAALGAGIWLVWDQARLVEVTSNSVNLNFDIIADTEAERVLATIIAGALMLPALMLLMFELKPSRRETVTYVPADTARRAPARVETRDDLADERARIDDSRADGRDARPSGSRRWHLFPRH